MTRGTRRPILLSGDAAPELEIDPSRPPLGLPGDWGTVTTRLLPHDRLLLSTDLECEPDAGEDRELTTRGVASSLG